MWREPWRQMRRAEAYAKGAVQKERTGIEKSKVRVEKILARGRRRCPSIGGRESARRRGEVLISWGINHHRLGTLKAKSLTCPGHPHHDPARASTTPSHGAPRVCGGGGGEEVAAAPASRGCPAGPRRPSPRAAPLQDRGGSRGQLPGRGTSSPWERFWPFLTIQNGPWAITMCPDAPGSWQWRGVGGVCG